MRTHEMGAGQVLRDLAPRDCFYGAAIAKSGTHKANRVISYVSLTILCSCIPVLLASVSNAGAQDTPSTNVTQFIEQPKDGNFDGGRSIAVNRVPLDPETLGVVGAAAAEAAPVLADVIDKDRPGSKISLTAKAYPTDPGRCLRGERSL